MLIYKKEVKMIPMEKFEPIEMKCDICGNKINIENWFVISTLHHDWGNDSPESLENFDACSDKCALKFAEKYLHDAYSREINTKEITIEHRRYTRCVDEDRDKIAFEDYVTEKED